MYVVLKEVSKGSKEGTYFHRPNNQYKQMS